MAHYVEGIKQLSFSEVKELYDQSVKKPILIDVRELEEYTEAHIPGIPLIPMSEIANRAGDFAKDEEYVFVCRSGRRSHEVAKFFQENGVDKVANYEGGMLEWDGPVETGEEHIVKKISELY
ncbi:rhodanese-like domain-containing protein [Salisediminibacterium halotolerans]|uniref:Rhodanese-related sulfurtransferase n=1 Tax=Salisediminibacterium halotolerans TaxID=517425 RepID=A0A1H9UM38_9BACI|nr:rhodanese-like domain-containing protein [Salisediminibacterium haloalkalitolerans]SES10409.1 Rhodanese-related sulfurtransferase [Salisediminibacterium haloalkalitolerans]